MNSQEVSLQVSNAGLPVRQEQVIRTGILSRSTLHRLKKKGLPTHKVGRLVFIDLTELREFLTK